jgi:hypothetical protein
MLSRTESNGSLPGQEQRSHSYKWICSQLSSSDQNYCPSHIDVFKKNITTWRPFGFEVQYCLSDPVPEKCRVQADLSVALIAGILSLAKDVFIAIVVFRS